MLLYATLSSPMVSRVCFIDAATFLTCKFCCYSSSAGAHDILAGKVLNLLLQWCPSTLHCPHSLHSISSLRQGLPYNSNTMAVITKVSVVIPMIMFFASVLALTGEPTIGASPAVLPYVNAPNMSSFSPPPSDEWDLGPAAPPRIGKLAPVPISDLDVAYPFQKALTFSATGITVYMEL
ncbi:hypothetical protein POTOM_053637 [Populus tomentosa]|uniref:Uncharacterized protein n=1 Tax=Populus tomentosa TaxID=118781 RepID=A0A8X8C4R2_POPTO|nr:hypothetical protein POTOM_053637 [Populus tomentosa]